MYPPLLGQGYMRGHFVLPTTVTVLAVFETYFGHSCCEKANVKVSTVGYKVKIIFVPHFKIYGAASHSK
jgi:hypothetical protein